MIPGTWRNGLQMHDVDNTQGDNCGTKEAKDQRAYLQSYDTFPNEKCFPGKAGWYGGLGLDRRVYGVETATETVASTNSDL